MRKLIGSLIVVGLLAVGSPAGAQFLDGQGAGDPLGLIASGAVIPYVGSTLVDGRGVADPTGVGGMFEVNSLTGTFGAKTHQGSLAILEVASPVSSNAGAAEFPIGVRELHMFFFSQDCVRVGPSVANPLTTNDADLVNLNLISNIPSSGLIAMAAVDQQFGVNDVLLPIFAPVHARVYWIDIALGKISRVLEPISIHNPEADFFFDGLVFRQTWNPLRTGATFVAPLEGSTVRSTLYLVCPTRNIIPGVFPAPEFPFSANTTAVVGPGDTSVPVVGNGTLFASNGTAWLNGTDAFTYTSRSATSFSGVSGIKEGHASGTIVTPVPFEFDPNFAFPPLHPIPVTGTQPTPLFLRVYDDEEKPLRNIDIFCRCWGAHQVAAIDPVYSSTIEAPAGTYTEIEGRRACGFGQDEECTFTGYNAIQWGNGLVGNDIFGRLRNGHFRSLQGIPSIPFQLGAIPQR
jgi:hypothetical protein